ncbi:hypothetical protein EZV62_021500 [Acer yangbiense]|uniref:Cytochrome P450 n=1 Tax=Acer yangbiense TaxID=1000413 RepID=A0A5C7H5W0_9ROSI|nr:hypothetical protein EZV62_021500 [Acer yangbiense]
MSHLCLTKERVNFPLFSPPSLQPLIFSWRQKNPSTTEACEKMGHMVHSGKLRKSFHQDRIRKYGPVSNLSLFGTPTVFLNGQTTNKLVYTCDGNTLANQQPPSIRRICSEKNITELRGDEHKRVRDALVSFLKPEVLKQYVGKMDEEIRKHLEMHWQAKGHGHETSATLLTFLVRLLASNSSVRANFVQEIARNKASGELLTWDDHGKMKYTWRVALEIRMDAPLPGIFMEILHVMLASSVTHMDEQLFLDPSKFDPTNFEKQAPPFSFVAFGGGPRICPGYEFARIETLSYNSLLGDPIYMEALLH